MPLVCIKPFAVVIALCVVSLTVLLIMTLLLMFAISILYLKLRWHPLGTRNAAYSTLQEL